MRIRAGDIDIGYDVAGPEGAPWVTFANSIASDRGMWRAQAAALAGRHRVLTFDARGHGDTTATTPPYSFDVLVGDVMALWAALGIERSHVVGLSLGGMVAVGLALAHRERLASLVVANSMMEATPQFVKSWDERIALARAKGLDAVVEPTLARWLTPAFVAAEPDSADDVRAMIRRTSRDGFIGAAEALKTLDFRRRLAAIRVPTLFIAGSEDIACPAAGVRAEAVLVPGAEFAVIEGAAHISNIERPDAVSRTVGDFIARHDAPA
ncbi:MAG: 3-oxoadipate enol-lactonase [Alphaproteobacteria bacterium]|nr:3-oxoadipate enol-lactonase [Alphaproteobacteria bacterium]